MPESQDPILVFIGQQRDGCVYELHPLSQERITASHPNTRLPSKIFIGFDEQAAFEDAHGPLWRQIAMLLTGLSWEELEQMGGVELYEPATDTRHPLVALAS